MRSHQTHAAVEGLVWLASQGFENLRLCKTNYYGTQHAEVYLSRWKAWRPMGERSYLRAFLTSVLDVDEWLHSRLW